MGTIADPWPKRTPPDGHPADGMTLIADVGDGAEMRMLDPRSFAEGSLIHGLCWGDAERLKYVAASTLMSYHALVTPNLSQREAIRRLRILRSVQRAAVALAKGMPDV